MRSPAAYDDWNELRGRNRSTLALLRALVIAVALVAAYAGGYALLVEPGQVSLEMRGLTVRYEIAPRYALGGTVAEFLFQPAHVIDRTLRPERWQGVGLPPSSGPSSRQSEKGARPGLRMPAR